MLARHIYTHFDRTEPNNNLIIRDVYNKRAEIRRRELNGRTPIQTLLQSLIITGEFSTHYQIKFGDQNSPLTHLFITHRPHKLLFTLNSEIIIIDLTYKTNRFKMPIFNFVGSTAMNQNFPTRNIFIPNEIVIDFVLPFNRSKRNAILLFTYIQKHSFPTAILNN